MAANRKKRKQSSINGHPPANIFNLRVTGIIQNDDNDDYDDDDDDLEGCLAEFESLAESTGEQKVSDALPVALPVALPQHHSDETNLVWDPYAPFHMDKNKENIHRWNAAFKLWGTSGKYEDALLPNFDVELARHFHVQKLSKHILNSHKEVRMPTFKRWLIDTKLEERMRKLSKSALDPVLPSVVNTEFEASQRLLQ